MPPLIAVHHTLADWDFQYGATNRSLSANQYVSAPTSLRILRPESGWFYDVVLCRHPDTHCLPQGEVRTWVYCYYASFFIAIFRNQAPLGSANTTSCYRLYLVFSAVHLDRWIDGAYSRRDSGSCTTFENQWTHYRIFWYNGKTPAEVPALCVDLYREIAGEWVKEGSTLYDTANSFKDSEINRAGFQARSGYNQPQYWDNTEIWGPV